MPEPELANQLEAMAAADQALRARWTRDAPEIGAEANRLDASHETALRDIIRRKHMYPVEDEAHLDERRAKVGLEPIAEYKSAMSK